MHVMQSYFSILVVYLYQRLFQWWPFLKENTLLCIQFGKEIQQDSMNIENLVTRLRETWVKNYKLNSIIDILKASSGGINKMIFFFEKYHIYFFFLMRTWLDSHISLSEIIPVVSVKLQFNCNQPNRVAIAKKRSASCKLTLDTGK